MTRRLITEAEAYELLKKAGVPVLECSVVRNADEAFRSARSIGYLVVLKVISTDRVHKSAAGWVMTGISSDDSVKSAFDSIMKNARKLCQETQAWGHYQRDDSRAPAGEGAGDTGRGP